MGEVVRMPMMGLTEDVNPAHPQAGVLMNIYGPVYLTLPDAAHGPRHRADDLDVDNEPAVPELVVDEAVDEPFRRKDRRIELPASTLRLPALFRRGKHRESGRGSRA